MTNWTDDEQQPRNYWNEALSEREQSTAAPAGGDRVTSPSRSLNASKFAIVAYMVGGYLFFAIVVIAVFLLAGFVQGDLR